MMKLKLKKFDKFFLKKHWNKPRSIYTRDLTHASHYI